ncbi:MAG: OB-fold nucleic acid binding domain-containing protein, partial [Mucinivorans sp.]
MELSEQEIVRRGSLEKLRELGIDPYPAAQFVVNATAEKIKSSPTMCEEKTPVSIAGRIMTRRIMGSASFFEIQDSSARIQIYIKRDDICPEGDPTLYNTVFKKLMDIGDTVGIEGFAFVTQTGEKSVHCQK